MRRFVCSVRNSDVWHTSKHSSAAPISSLVSLSLNVLIYVSTKNSRQSRGHYRTRQLFHLYRACHAVTHLATNSCSRFPYKCGTKLARIPWRVFVVDKTSMKNGWRRQTLAGISDVNQSVFLFDVSTSRVSNAEASDYITARPNLAAFVLIELIQ